MFLCSVDKGRFFVPAWSPPRRRAQLRSSRAAGHRRSRRAACLTAASTAPASNKAGHRDQPRSRSVSSRCRARRIPPVPAVLLC